MSHTLSPQHFLSLPRPSVTHLGAMSDTSSLTVHDFDVDLRTGFMPPQPPLERLPQQWEPWEQTLQDALARKLKLGERSDLTPNDRLDSEDWRQGVQRMPTLPIEELAKSEVLLRRAHHVLTFTMHIFIHTLPAHPSSPVCIPASISVPLLQVSSSLALPPILTYADTVLYNWDLTNRQSKPSPFINPSHLRSQTTFTGTRSEEHFYLTSARIELAGVSALSLLRLTMDEAFVGDLLSLRRISQYLAQLATVIETMTVILKNIHHGCDPKVFYEEIRPWFRGQGDRPWIFEGAEAAGLAQPTELSGPSAGQSSLIHLLDIFLGVHQPSESLSSSPFSHARAEKSETPFLERMQSYMPRHHRAFLNHLKVSHRPIRAIVTAADTAAPPEEREVRKGLKEAYNASVTAVKRFRDAHIRIATLYIITQARRGCGAAPVQQSAATHEDKASRPVQQGTGGTDLVPFLKGVRDRTAASVLSA